MRARKHAAAAKINAPSLSAHLSASILVAHVRTVAFREPALHPRETALAATRWPSDELDDLMTKAADRLVFAALGFDRSSRGPMARPQLLEESMLKAAPVSD
eukprot:3306935-Prymnesium_polylepis.3